MRLIVSTLIWLLVLSGCATLPNTLEETIDDRLVESALSGDSGPVVVFENGLGGGMEWWAKVLPELAGEARLFAYNRAGYGASAAMSAARDGEHVVDELRRLLRAKQLSPPYLLVGHSLGGLYMQLFARRYPDEVGGLILVDSTHPRQMEGAGAYQNWPLWLRMLFSVLTSETAKQELAAIDATGEQVLALPSVSGKPVLVLSALQPTDEHSELADHANAKRRDLLRLYPGGRQVWVDSGHAIPLEKPDAVVSAIRELLKLRAFNGRGAIQSEGLEIR